MPLYVTDELAFEVPEPFEDRTLHELELSAPDDGLLAVHIRRAPMPTDTTLAEAVSAHVKAEARRLPLHRVLEVKDRTVDGAPGIEVVSSWMHGRREILAREIHVAHRGTRLAFSATTVAPGAAARDAYFDRMVATLKLDSGEEAR
jgi:hypothetical protein